MKIIFICKNIKIIKKHSLSYKEHTYARYEEIKIDIDNACIQLIIRKCKDYNYLTKF